MASPQGSVGIIEILHTCVLQDCISDSGVPGYILKTILDVNNPTGALVFVCVVSGIFVVFIAILDTLKPPNFPPGPRWLPFGGDSSAAIEKPITKTTASKLLKRFGPVVGLRRKSGPRNPVVLALDAVSTETVEHAARNGFLEIQSSECPEFKISEFTGISHSLRWQIHSALMSKDANMLIENSAYDSTKDLFEILTDTPQELNSSLISKTILAALLNVVTGRRIKPSSPYLTHLQRILINKSIPNYVLNDNHWTGNFESTLCAAKYYSNLIMVLSDLHEDTKYSSAESDSQNVFNFLTPNYRLVTLPEKCTIVADILLCAEIGLYLDAMDEVLNILNVKQPQVHPSAEILFDTSSKAVCFELCRSLIYNLSKRHPLLDTGRRWEVLKRFYIKGFSVPKGSTVQTVLFSHQESQPTSDEMIPYKHFTMNLLALVLSEIVAYYKRGNVMNQ